MCLILFVFLMCYVEIMVLVFLILLGWSVLIVASHIIRGIWSMGNLFFPGASRAFFTAVGGLFVFVAFQPAYGQARQGGAVNIRELALVDISAPLWRIGRSPEKLQIFLCYSPIPFCAVWELKPLAIVPISKGLDLILAVFEAVM